MVNQELLDYVKEALSKGISKEKLKEKLLQLNWPEQEINEVIKLSLKKNNKKIIIAISILIIILIPVIVFRNQIFISSKKDCTNDFNCFIGKAKNCQESSLRHIYVEDSSNILVTTTRFYEIKGKQQDKCLFYIKIENKEITFNNNFDIFLNQTGYSQQEIDKLKSDEIRNTNLDINKQANCLYDKNYLSSMLKRWQNQEFNYEEDFIVNGNCRGTLLT